MAIQLHTSYPDVVGALRLHFVLVVEENTFRTPCDGHLLRGETLVFPTTEYNGAVAVLRGASSCLLQLMLRSRGRGPKS